jgi:DNA-directed RNA polymerase subunit RPC12/RpoP
MSIPYICAACGAQFAEASSEPARCPICEDSRGFGEERGRRQRWTSLAELRIRHRNLIREIDPGVISIVTEPQFSVGHHCVLVQGEAGNILWDCISLIDDATIEAVRELGGISAIAISHPHFYASMVEWSRAFGYVPIYLHHADREWVLRSDPAVVFWEGDSLPLNEELTLVHCGGHFDGGTVLHWAGRAGRAGRLLTGDVIAVLGDHENVTFMHNYPKQIPLPASAIHRIVEAIEPFEFDRIYGCWPQDLIPAGAKQAVLRSAERYVQQVAT